MKIVFLSAALLTLLLGCGTNTSATNDAVLTGTVKISISRPEVIAEVLSDRFVFDDVVAQFRRTSDDAVLREAVLTVANPSATFSGLAAGTVGYGHADIRASGVAFTDGRSANVTILAGQTVSANITVAATKAEVSLVSPEHSGDTVTTSAPALVVHVKDPGGKPVTAVLYRTDVGSVSLGTRVGTNENLNWGDSGLVDGVHSYRLDTTTVSGGSWSYVFTLNVDTSGGVTIGIGSRGAGLR